MCGGFPQAMPCSPRCGVHCGSHLRVRSRGSVGPQGAPTCVQNLGSMDHHNPFIWTHNFTGTFKKKKKKQSAFPNLVRLGWGQGLWSRMDHSGPTSQHFLHYKHGAHLNSAFLPQSSQVGLFYFIYLFFEIVKKTGTLQNICNAEVEGLFRNTVCVHVSSLLSSNAKKCLMGLAS